MATGQGRDGRPPIEEIAQALGISKQQYHVHCQAKDV